MSSHTSAGTPEADTGAGPTDYQEMLETLDVAIEEARRKVESGRVDDAENEKARIEWIGTLSYAVNVRRRVTIDRTLEKLSERIEAIEAAQEGQR